MNGYLLIALAALLLVLFASSVYAPVPASGTDAGLSFPYPSIHSDDPQKGGFLDAPLAIVHYGQYTCEVCKEFSRLLDTALERYGSNLLIVWKDMVPPGSDTLALAAAEVARCAGEQNAYWQMHDLLFTEQGLFTKESIRIYWENLGLDEQQYLACLDEDRGLEAIERDFAEAVRLGLERTPAFFVNDDLFYGLPNTEEFLKYLDDVLRAQ